MKRQMSRGCRVGNRCDELRRQRQRYRWEKKEGMGGSGCGEVSLCDADDDAISPALWQPMGSAPGDV